MPDGPVERYLRELRRQLPYPAPRLVAETREHLLEGAAGAVAKGLSQHDAEQRAVESYGPVNDVVAAVLEEGSAFMSPRVARWLVRAAVLLSVPTAVFVFVNVIEELAGSAGSEGVFGTTFDAWGTQINGLVVFGPLIAVALIVATSLRVHRERDVDGFAATIELSMSRATFWAAVAVSLLAALVIGYLAAENYGAMRDFHNQSWTCMTENGGQVCYQGNSLGESRRP